MRRYFLTALTSAGLLLPAMAYAVEVQTFELSKGRINANWSGKGDIAMEQRDDGILLKSGNGTGYFLTQDIAFFPEGVTLIASTERPVDVNFMWILENELIQQEFYLPIVLPAGSQKYASFSLSSADDWSGSKKQIGLKLPPHTSIVAHGIELYKWNIVEKATEAVRSFWRFDKLRPYGINFVWGPQIAFNPIERTQLYSTLPPTSLSGTLAVFAALLIVLILFLELPFLLRVKHEKKRWIAMHFGMVLLVVWILFDLRMGSEFLSWVTHDHRTYIAADATTREFRERDRFYDFAETAALFVQDRGSYIFFAEQPWPYLGNMRYITYPAIPGIDIARDDTWVVYRRPDITVTANGELAVDGEPVTGPGKILERFDDMSFIFRTNIPPSQ